MPPKDCDPRCTGKCNKKRLTPVQTSDKACDPRCTGRCSKKNAGNSPMETYQPVYVPPLNNEKPSTLLPSGTVKFVIMDLDGVILDIETVYQWLIEELVKKYGIPPENTQHIIDLQDEETAKKICTDYNLPISPQDFMIEFRNTSIKLLAKTPTMPGIEKLVDYFLKNDIPVAVASTSNEEAYKLKTQKHKHLFNKFCHIVLGGSDPEVDARKPSPILYQVCGSRFPSKPDPKSILVFEDAPEGVVAARGAQMNVVWFPNKYMRKGNNNGALAVYDSILEFDPHKFGLPEFE